MRILLILFFLGTFLFSSQNINTSKRVLLLHSYHKGMIWADDISKAVESVLLRNKNHKIEFTTEYMDSKKNASSEYNELIYKVFEQKLEYQKYDLVIASDNLAVKFVLKNRKKFFKDIPIIFCGLDEDNPGINIKRALETKINIVFENRNIINNIELIKEMLPETKNIYVINGPTPSSQLVNIKIKKIIKEYEGKINIILNSTGFMDEIKNDVKKLPKNSVVLTGSLYRNANGDYIPYYEINEMIEQSHIPVFSFTESYLNRGIVGGYLTRGYHQGNESVKIAMKHLTNKEVDYSKAILAPVELILDYKILERFNFNKELIPSNAKIINAPLGFFDEYRELVDKVFLIFPFIVIFLIIAVVNIIKRRKAEKLLIAQSSLQKVLLNNIQSSVFWVDKEGLVQGCNESFCEFFKIKSCNVLGENIDTLFKKCKLPINKNKLTKANSIDFVYDKKDFVIRNKNFLNEDSEDAGIISIITDITDKKQFELNKQFIIQQSKLAEVGEMLSAIVHQWKVPLVELSAVAHKMQYLNEEKMLDDKQIEHIYNTIMKEIIFMSDTIDNFRAFIKPSSKPSSFNMDVGINEILSILSSSLKYDNIKIELENKIKKDASIYGYPNEFKQVILNIINNAKESIIQNREKNKDCGVIKIIICEKANLINLTIEDDGVGIKPSQISKIFDSYYTTKKNGDGIGLYMAKLIIENKMNGIIKAENVKNGAKFLISLQKNNIGVKNENPIT